MQLQIKKISIILAFLVLFSCQPPNYNPADLHKWMDDYMAAIKSSNIERLLPLFSDNVQYLPPNHTVISGKEALTRWFLSYFNYYENISEKLWTREAKVAGDYAYVNCNYSIFVTADNEEFRDSGKIIFFFRHQHLGTWICTHVIWNNNNRTFDLHSEIPADFSGHWKLDLRRSTANREVTSATLFITQDRNNISINRFYEMNNKETLETSFHYLIGKEVKNTNNTESFSTRCYWSTDKQSFTTIETIDSEKTGATQKYVRKTVYAIIAKGETLSIISDDMIPEVSLIPVKERHLEMFYNKL